MLFTRSQALRVSGDILRLMLSRATGFKGSGGALQSVTLVNKERWD